MADLNLKDKENNNYQIIERDSLGEFLRKVRIGNRIDVNKMAKDTKLSIDYITAIEKDDFKKIPGETYRKIFVKNVARYLELDPEEIYKRYLKETGTQLEVPVQKQAKDPNKPAEITLPARSPRNIIIVLAAVLAIFILIIISGNEKKQPVHEKEAIKEPPAQDTVTVSAPSEKPKDIPPKKAAVKPPVQVKEAVQPVEKKKEPKPLKQEAKASVQATLNCLQDSVLVYAYRKGKLSNNMFRKGDTQSFAGDSAIFFNISSISKISLNLNGNPVTLDSAAGKILRVDTSGITYLSGQKWDQLIKKE
jgi:cytoskeletal protein RodZ